jgi:hypothetical protein
MLQTLWIFFCWFSITFSLAGLVAVLVFYHHDRQRKRHTHQLVVGPFRANLRRVR